MIWVGLFSTVPVHFFNLTVNFLHFIAIFDTIFLKFYYFKLVAVASGHRQFCTVLRRVTAIKNRRVEPF